MRGSILHKELFKAKTTNTDEYLDALMVNEQTLQLDEVWGLAARAGLGVVKFGQWVMKNPFRNLLGAPIAATGGYQVSTKIIPPVTNMLANIAKGGEKFTEDPGFWKAQAIKAGLAAGLGIYLYNKYQDWRRKQASEEEQPA